MRTKVQKWGNSQGLRLAKQILEDAQITVGDNVDVSVQDNVIIVAPVKRQRGRYRLENLVAEIPAKYKIGEEDWGDPEGREEW